MKRKPTKAKALSDNQGLIVSIAKRYIGKGTEFLDLLQAGNLGLLEALKRFKPKKNVKFITYAYPWIRKFIQEAVYGGHLVRVPQNVQQVRNKIAQANASYIAFFGNKPSMAELSAMTEIPLEKVESASFDGRVYPIDDDTSSASDEVTDLHNSCLSSIDKSRLRELIYALPEQERMIMMLRIYEEKTLEEVGHRLKLTRERIRQIEERIKGKLRKRAVA